MSSNKQNLDFYLPSLINNHKFQEIFYHHNKLIVYDSTHTALISPKPFELLERPKTSVSISVSNKLSTRLVQARSKASIDKFISTHKRIYQEKKKAQNSCHFPIKKYNRMLVKRTEASKLQTVLTQNQSIRRDQPILTQAPKQSIINALLTNSSTKNLQNMEPEDKLIKQIVEKAEKVNTFERKSVRVSTKQINSVDRPQSRKSIIPKTPDENNTSMLSGSRQKITDERSKGIRVARKSFTVNPKDAQKTPKSHLSSFSNCSTKAKSKKALNKQPAELNLLTQESYEQRNLEEEAQTLKALLNPLYALYVKKDVYKKSDFLQEMQDSIQITQQYGVLPRECFYSSETEKRRSYIDSRIHHLERKLHEQQDIINHQDQEIHNLLSQRQENSNPQMENLDVSLLGSSTSELKQTSNLKPLLRLSEIQQENQSGQNGGNGDDEKNEQALKQEIDNLNAKSVQNQQLLENSKLQNSNSDLLGNDSESNPFYRSKLSPEIKKLVLTSRLREKQNQLQIQQSQLKRAEITKFLDKEYFNNIKGLYWALIHQKQNAFLAKRPNQVKQAQNTESFKYIKEFHKNRSQLLEESLVEEGPLLRNEEKIFVDREFMHDTIQLSSISEEVHWLYFKPCPQSSIFPAELKLPQHYITTENHSSSINSLVSLLNCILNLNPYFVERLFEPTYNNVFSCWLNRNGQFEPIYVDGYLPYNGKLNSFLAWSEEFLWIGVLLKCCAKLYGGYEQLLKLSLDDWSQMILGRALTKLPKPSYKEIKQWPEQEFEQRVIEYLSKYQQKHKSTIVVRHKLSESLYLITGIKNKKIKLSHIDSETKRLEVSLYEFIIEEYYELVLFPESCNLYLKGWGYSSYEKGNIVTFQVKVEENKSCLTLCTQLINDEYESEENLNKTKKDGQTKKDGHERRRMLVYEIPYQNKRDKKTKSEMILKYSSDNHPYTKVSTNSLGVSTLQMDIPDIKKGSYKIFIQCGKIKLNDYFQSHSKTLTKELKTEEEFREKLSPRGLNGQQNENKKYRNGFSVLCSNPVGLKGGKSLIINEMSMENQVLEDEHFVYRHAKSDVRKEDSDYV